MTIDELQAYLVTYLNPCIAARSTTLVPLSAVAADQIYTRNYQLPAKGCTIFLDQQQETAEPFTMGSRVIRLPVEIIAFTQGATEALLRAQASAYMTAIFDCVALHPDFMSIESRDQFDGVEGKLDIKAAKAVVIFEYEENL